MANPTSNFGWQMPTPTDLVTDLPADFEVFGQAVDTSLADLKGGTSGQVLSKNSNTDMDFTWVAQDDSNAIQNAIVDAKGDLIAASAADTPARLAVGANDLLLTAASGEATGLKYTGAWTSFTPSWTNVTVGNGTSTGAYCKIGKMVFVKVSFSFGSTSSFTGSVSMTAPILGANTARGGYQGSMRILDNGVQWYIGLVDPNEVGDVECFVENSSLTYGTRSNINATTPMTWATGDLMQFYYYYEAA